jgi:hypothetical protein
MKLFLLNKNRKKNVIINIILIKYSTNYDLQEPTVIQLSNQPHFIINISCAYEVGETVPTWFASLVKIDENYY